MQVLHRLVACFQPRPLKAARWKSSSTGETLQAEGGGYSIKGQYNAHLPLSLPWNSPPPLNNHVTTPTTTLSGSIFTREWMRLLFVEIGIIEQTRAAARLSTDLNARTKESIISWPPKRDTREPALRSVHLGKDGWGGGGFGTLWCFQPWERDQKHVRD